MNFVDELKWRGMIHDMMPGTEEQLQKEMTTAYVGIDPTADSLHIGHLVSIMMLKHFQIAGHKPLALIGGATGMIGDPSGKSQERNMLSEEELNHNVLAIQNQLRKFLDFETGQNKAEMVNNYDWMKDFSFLRFLREIGKHITVNYMMAKDSVKKRISGEAREGLSFTEFTYQLVQGYDFLHLYQAHNCKLQMGGSDQWGNITTGTELIRRKTGGEAFALTCPLITKADGGKFGKTEKGNIWLDSRYTSPYQFYQFWLNCSDTDAEKYIRIFTLMTKDHIDALVAEHTPQPHLRILQKALARDITTRVHSEKDYEMAVGASEILFGKGTTDTLKNLPENILLDVFDGVPMFTISRAEIENGLNIIDFLGGPLQVLKSKGEARRAIKEGSISINKDKIDEDFIVDSNSLLNNKYILAQRGKKNFFLIKTDT